MPGVNVNLPELGLTATTNQFGKFHFDIKGAKSSSSSLIAQKDGYEIWNDDVKLDNTKLEFTMKRKPIPPKPDLNPKEVIKKPKITEQREPATQVLSGVILGEGNEPLAGVTVTLVDFDLTTTTDQIGKYKFQTNKAKKQQTVNLIARKTGYKSYNSYALMGNTAHNFTMEAKP